MSKYTPWFPGDVKPVRAGVYERQPDFDTYAFSFWNGHAWMSSDRTPKQAMAQQYFFQSQVQNQPWRGLLGRSK